jgi:hypothetical protein
MSADERDSSIDSLDSLDSLVMGARACIEAELTRERRYVSPDFAAVVAAAHARDPRLVSEAALREVGGLAPVIELESGTLGDGDELLADSTLDAWINDARAVTEADIAARRLTSIPPLRATTTTPFRRELSWLGLAVALVAVVAGLAVAVPRLLETLVDGNYREATSKPNQAEHLEHERDSRAGAELRPTPGPIRPTPQRAVVHDLEAPRERSESGSGSGSGSGRARETSLRDQISELEVQAQALWTAGELERAQASYREIIALAGRRRYADLAYGDLFTLARQRGDAAAELALWNEYLVAFPSGRFADDVRARLCRRASAGERDGCWREYLADFPEGVHTNAAASALAAEVP